MRRCRARTRSWRTASHITGKVTGPDGVGAPGNVSVQAYQKSPGPTYWPVDRQVDVHERGRGVRPGRPEARHVPDRVLDLPGGLRRRVLGRRRDRWTSATDIVVGAGVTVSGKNAQLVPASHITGTVTGVGGGALADVDVTAYQWDAVDEYWEQVAYASTNGSGEYDLRGLRAGTYRIGFKDPTGDHVSEYFDDARTVRSATDVVVGTDATVSGVDAELVAGSRVTGTVSGVSDLDLWGVRVTAYSWDPEEGYWTSVHSVGVSPDGSYELGGLSAGTYRLGFDDWSGDYAPEYFDDVATIEAAADIMVGDRVTVSGKDAQLVPAGRISGTVTGPAGADLSEVLVWTYVLEDGSWQPQRGVNLAPDGSYELDGLRPGTYRLGFEDESGALATEFYDDVATVDAATDVVVASGASVEGKDAELRAVSPADGAVPEHGPPTISGTPQVDVP